MLLAELATKKILYFEILKKAVSWHWFKTMHAARLPNLHWTWCDEEVCGTTNLWNGNYRLRWCDQLSTVDMMGNLQTVIQPVNGFIENLCNMSEKAAEHHFIAKSQDAYLCNLKDNLSPADTAIIWWTLMKTIRSFAWMLSKGFIMKLHWSIFSSICDLLPSKCIKSILLFIVCHKWRPWTHCQHSTCVRWDNYVLSERW